MITIRSNYRDLEKEFDRLEAMPTPSMVANLEAVLDFGFDGALGVVHIDTGKLKKSGKKTSKANKNDWKGQFTFPAKNKKGTKYGMYERKRGGFHDFLRQTPALKPLFKIAIKAVLRHR